MVTMKRCGIVAGLRMVLVGLLILCVFSHCGYSSTSCRQSFHLLFLTESRPLTLWVGEDLSGECSLSRLVQVVLEEPHPRTVYTLLEEMGRWQWLARQKTRLKHFALDSLIWREGLWWNRSGTIQLASPPADSGDMTAFWQHIAGTGSGAESWNRLHGLDGVEEPLFLSGNGQLLYAYPAGLYINYRIAKAYWFPDPGLLVLFTTQEQLAPGLDTMNGFLVYRVKAERVSSDADLKPKGKVGHGNQ